MVLSTVEFAVNLSCDSCVKNVKNQLEGVEGIENVKISLENQSVVLNTALPSFEVQRLIEQTGKQAVLKGYGSEERNLGSAVAQLAGESGFSSGILKGVVRFVQSDAKTCVVEGTIDGLTPGSHNLQVHECGDISKGCDSVGDIFNPGSEPLTQESKELNKRLAGDLGKIQANAEGRAEFRFEDSLLKVWDIIGRSLVIAKSMNDGLEDLSQSDSEQRRLACAIIARSAGLFENTKKICACDGVSIWDERNRPLTGPGRQSETSKTDRKIDGISSCSVG
ncbi:unnamed protein product [Bemisia tabaci]|uniref:Superoxide dismutase copper chaperone n=1 Tax=Bemisia tabaci TaxID=7038 RepID=A0A9P0AJD3_BEMTA|nr:unnamed protein product [Bemisia tabaci]